MAQNLSLSMQDREMMYDALRSEKQMTGLYNTRAGECVSTALRDEMLNILHDAHSMQADIYLDMQKRGWCSAAAAEDQKVQSAREKFSGMNAGS
ncbi:MAG: spore coat protein [Clostridiales bacterium]|nr:spore coat protein [Clostridiales bacterium]